MLSQTGSLYLHCDPNASHYLKGVLDAIFGDGKFRNEIVWCYTQGGRPKKDFPNKHEIIFRYTKSAKYVFDTKAIKVSYELLSVKSSDSFTKVDEDGRYYKEVFGSDRKKKYRYYKDEGKVPYDWWILPKMTGRTAASKNEYLGYPTQKPRELYERMIKASSKPGDLVLDPFCGCGTTIDAAHTLNRDWIGIDLTILALDPMQKRMSDRHGLNPSIDYEIEGYPTNMQEVRKLVQEQRKRHDFANWAVTRLGLEATQDVADGGFDGTGKAVIWNPRFHKEIETCVIAEVKSGAFTVTDVRAFCQVMWANQAEVGIFITLDPITSGMRRLQEDMGTFEHNNRTYNRLQFWQIDDGYFETPDVVNQILSLPWMIESRSKSERHVEDRQGRFL